MQQKKLKAIIKKKVGIITHLCRDVDTAFDKDTVHDFRTSVKSLRSFLRLQQMHTGKHLKIPKKFKRLYHIAGVIREAQLEIEHFEGKKPDLPHYVEHLYLIIARQKKEWRNLYSKKVLRRFNKKISGYKYKSIHPGMLEKFFDDRVTVVNFITHKVSPTDEQVHTARKKIKDILYTSKIAEKKWNATHKEVELISVKKLDQLADMIGDYNDERITLEHLRAFSTRRLSKNEKSTLSALKTKETKKLSARKKSIMAVAKNFTGLAIHSKR